MAETGEKIRELWRVDRAGLRVVKTRGASYHERDAEGCQIYVNSHFTDESSAWKRLERELLAEMYSRSRDAKDARKRMRKAQRNAARLCREYSEFRENWEAAEKLTREKKSEVGNG